MDPVVVPVARPAVDVRHEVDVRLRVVEDRLRRAHVSDGDGFLTVQRTGGAQHRGERERPAPMYADLSVGCHVELPGRPRRGAVTSLSWVTGREQAHYRMSRPAADAGGEQGREGAASHPSPSSTIRGGSQPFGGGPAAPQNPVITDAGTVGTPCTRLARSATSSGICLQVSDDDADRCSASRSTTCSRAPLAGDRDCYSAEAEGPAPRVALWACLNMQARRSANCRRPYIVFRSQPALGGSLPGRMNTAGAGRL